MHVYVSHVEGTVVIRCTRMVGLSAGTCEDGAREIEIVELRRRRVGVSCSAHRVKRCSRLVVLRLFGRDA